MGLVYLTNKGLIKPLAEATIKYSKALIEPGKLEAEVKVAPLTADEVNLILLKLDILASEKANPAIAAMVAEEAESILLAIRMVKAETKASFAGILGSGANLDIMWLRPQDIGGSPMRGTADVGSLGLWAGTGAAVYTWLHAWTTAHTAENMIPSQTMAEEGAVIHLGAIDPIEVPKCNAIQFTLAGIPSPPQSLSRNIRKGFGTEDVPVMRFEKPIIVGPEKTQLVQVNATTSGGDTRLQLLSLLITKAETLSL
ncbi:hypothetical protein ES703_44609 [subsurface metagenome]